MLTPRNQDYPQTASFLDLHEKEIIIGRLPPSAPSVVTKHVRCAEVLDALKDWRMYALSVALMCTLMTLYSIAYFLPMVGSPVIVSAACAYPMMLERFWFLLGLGQVIYLMGFGSTTSQLLSIAPEALAAAWVVFM